MTRILLAAALTISTAAAAAPAFAQDTVSTTVRTSDLNLSTSVGEMLLERRIGATIDRMCGQADPREVAASLAVLGCRKSAWASARPQIAVDLAAAKTAAPAFRVASR